MNTSNGVQGWTALRAIINGEGWHKHAERLTFLLHLRRAFLPQGYFCQGSVIAFVSKFVLPSVCELKTSGFSFRQCRLTQSTEKSVSLCPSLVFFLQKMSSCTPFLPCTLTRIPSVDGGLNVCVLAPSVFDTLSGPCLHNML